jgi:hypothetical protein
VKRRIELKAVMPKTPGQRLAVFSLLGLGIIDSLASGMLTATDAIRTFFHADNCLFVRQSLRNKIADRLMSAGVQLPDLFDALPAEEAYREFQHELTEMRTLCLKLLEDKTLVA